MLGLLLWLGLDVAGLKKFSPMIHTSTLIGFLLIGGLAFSGWGLYRTFRPRAITLENVEPYIRDWLDGFHIGTRRLEEASFHFAFEVTLQSGITVAIVRTRDRPNYIIFSSRLTLTPEQKVSFDKLSEQEKESFIRELRLEGAKAKISFSLDRQSNIITIQRQLAITDALSEADLLGSIDEANFSAIVMIDTIEFALKRRQEIKQPPPTPDTGASPP